MKDLESHLVLVGFKAPADLVEWADAAAKKEGISRSDIARRALMIDRERRGRVQSEDAA